MALFHYYELRLKFICRFLAGAYINIDLFYIVSLLENKKNDNSVKQEDGIILSGFDQSKKLVKLLV